MPENDRLLNQEAEAIGKLTEQLIQLEEALAGYSGIFPCIQRQKERMEEEKMKSLRMRQAFRQACQTKMKTAEKAEKNPHRSDGDEWETISI